MNLKEYSERALTTLTAKHDFGDIDATLMAQVLGLSDESGEVLSKFKKLIRDKGGVMSEEDKTEIMKELGDVLWYISTISHLMGFTLDEVAAMNLDKLASRKRRGKLSGSGDNR